MTASEAKALSEANSGKLISNEIICYYNKIREAATKGYISITTDLHLPISIQQQLEKDGYKVSIINDNNGFYYLISWI